MSTLYNIQIRILWIIFFLYSAMQIAGSSFPLDGSLIRNREEEASGIGPSKRSRLDFSGGELIVPSSQQDGSRKIKFPILGYDQRGDEVEAKWIRDINRIATEFPNAVELYLESCAIPQYLSSFPFTDIVKLDLSNVQISSAALSSLCRNTPLQELYIYNPKSLLPGSLKLTLPTFLDKLKNFNALSLKDDICLDDTFNMICIFSQVGMLSGGMSLQKINQLTLSGIRDLSSEQIKIIVQKWPLLRKLSLENCQIKDLPPEFADFSKLEELDLSDNRELRADVLVYIPTSVCELDISFTNPACVNPNNWLHLQALRYVRVDNSNAGRGNMLYPLEDFMNFPQIESICFADNAPSISKQELIIYSQIVEQLRQMN